MKPVLHAACAALMAMLAPAPAMAADNIGCVLDALTPEQRTELTARLGSDGDVGDVITDASVSCLIAHKWSAEAVGDAIGYSVARLLKEHAAAALTTAKVPMASLDALFAELPADIRAALTAEDGLNEDHGLAIAQLMVRRDIPVEGRLPEDMGRYLATRALEEKHRDGFQAH